MSLINDKTAIKSTIAQLEQSGEIEIDFVQPISQKIESIFNRTDFDQLFTDAIEVLNEQSIILDEKTTKRPDKIILKKNETIILDYKTGIPSAKDEKQISEYVATLQKMDYPNVKGYLFYTALNELKGVG
jgi:ribosomal protein L16 Arg81 hydroxylase